MEKENSMEKIDILIWSMGGGFAGTWMMMLYCFSQINKRLDRIDDRLNGIESRIARVEGMLMNKECCMIATQHRKAE